MAIVSCPECSKKLKVADTSVGKKVKCSCGNVFVATGDAPSAPKPAPAAAAVAPEKVYVGCTECGAKLKVATTSLGKKMKCPKCTAVFVAEVADDAPAAPPPPLAKPTAKPKPAPKEDDLDDLFSFAQEDAANDDGGILDDDEDEAPKPKAKGKPAPSWGDEDEDETPKIKGKVKAPAGWGGDDDDSFEDDAPKARPSAKSGWGDDEDDDDDMPKAKGKPQPKKKWESDKPSGAPVYPSRMVANLLTVFFLLIFLGLFGALMADVNLADLAGIKESKGVPKGKENDGKNLAATENKKELERFNGTWVVESAEMPGMALDALKGQKFIFANGKVTTPDPIESAFNVDVTKDPKWISLPTLSGLMVSGIYKLDGDTLQWCTALPKKIAPNQFIPGDRPTKFDANEGVLITLSREKKKDDNNPPTKELKLPGSAGPRVMLLAKPPAGNEANLFFVSSKDDRDKPKKDWDQNFPSGTSELAVGIVFKELEENAKLKVSIFTTTGAIKPAAFQDFVVTKRDDDVLVTFECLPQGGEFADGPYQAIVTLDKVDIAQLNWSVGEKVDENPKEKTKDKDKDGKEKDLDKDKGKDKDLDKDKGKDKDLDKDKGKDKDLDKDKGKDKDLDKDKGKDKDLDKDKGKDKEVKNPALGKYYERQKEELAWLAEVRKSLPKDAAAIVSGILPQPRVAAMAFAAEAPLFATADDKDGVKLWDLKNAQATKTIPTPIFSDETLLAFSPDGSLIALVTDKDKGRENLELKIWKTEDGADVKAITLPGAKYPMGLQFTADGSRLTLILRSEATGYEAVSWDTAEWQEKKWVPESKFGHCFFAANGNHLYEITNPNGLVTIRDLRTDKTRTFDSKNTSISSDRVTPNDKAYLNTKAGPFGDVKLIDLATGEATMVQREKANVYRVQFTGDSRYLFYSVGNAETKMIDLATAKVVSKLPGTQMFLVSPGGAFLARWDKAGVVFLAIDDLQASPKAPEKLKDDEQGK